MFVELRTRGVDQSVGLNKADSAVAGPIEFVRVRARVAANQGVESNTVANDDVVAASTHQRVVSSPAKKPVRVVVSNNRVVVGRADQPFYSDPGREGGGPVDSHYWIALRCKVGVHAACGCKRIVAEVDQVKADAFPVIAEVGGAISAHHLVGSAARG